MNGKVLLKNVVALLRLPHLLGCLQVASDMRASLRIHFLYCAIETGLLKAIRAPTSKLELERELGVQRTELLEALLNLGLSCGEICHERGLYRIRGSRSRALATQSADALAALVQEYVIYYGSVYRHLSERLRGSPLGSYLEGTGSLIARSSRILEPYMANYVRDLVRHRKPNRILEIGCGSGIYLLHAAKAHSELTGVAIDMQEDVVEQARANLAAWGIADRFEVLLADIRRPPEEISGPFDLVTLYNNIYYFQVEERPPLFRSLRARLAPGGALAIVSAMQGKSLDAANFDLVLRSTVGCTALPEADELSRQLREGGFSTIRQTKFLPGESLVYGFLASRGS